MRTSPCSSGDKTLEVSFRKEIESLRLGAGETFHGEGILAITKALLQSGVAYVGGYQGAPVSHLLDVMVQAKPYMDELGVHVEACANEASAAAMLGASIHYPLRGAVTWKSIVGTNVAADALSNLSSPGVTGGALIVVGEDYGEGAIVIQERTHAYALKSPHVPARPAARPRRAWCAWSRKASAVGSVEHAGACWSCASAPAMCAAASSAKDNVPPAVSTRALMEEPAGFDYTQLAHPPVTFRQEKLKGEERIPAARRYIVEHKLNELIAGQARRPRHHRAGRPVQLADAQPAAAGPGRCVRRERHSAAGAQRHLPAGARGDRATSAPASARVLVVEEGQPEYIEQEIARHCCAGATSRRRCTARTCCRRPASTRVEVLPRGLADFVARLSCRSMRRRRRRKALARTATARAAQAVAQRSSTQPLPTRPPQLLHRLPGAAGVLGAQAGAAGHRPGAHRRRHRLPRLRAPSSRSRWATRSSATA